MISALGPPIRPQKKVAERLTAEQGAPAPAAMLRGIVEHMAALTEGRQIGVPVVGVLVEIVGDKTGGIPVSV